MPACSHMLYLITCTPHHGTQQPLGVFARSVSLPCHLCTELPWLQTCSAYHACCEVPLLASARASTIVVTDSQTDTYPTCGMHCVVTFHVPLAQATAGVSFVIPTCARQRLCVFAMSATTDRTRADVLCVATQVCRMHTTARNARYKKKT